MTDKDLDNLITNKLNQQQFEFNDAYWLQAQKLINAQRLAVKKMLLLKTGFYVATLFIFGLLSWFLINGNISNKNDKIIANKISSTLNTKLENNEPKSAINNKNLKAANKSIIAEKQIETLSKNRLPQLSFTNKNKVNKNNKRATLLINNNNEFYNNEINTSNVNDFEILASKQPLFIDCNLVEPTFEFKKINLIKAPQYDKKNKRLNTVFNMGFEIGINSFNSVFSSNSIGYYAGTNLYFGLGKLMLIANINYENINQNLAARNYTIKTYDFTSKTTLTTVQNKSIDYAIIGINAMYPIYNNHSIGTGFQLAQMVQSNDLLTVNDFENNTAKTIRTNNYNSTINSQDLQLTFKYQYRFVKHFALGVTYVYGLNNVSKTEALKYNNQGLKLGIQYIIK